MRGFIAGLPASLSSPVVVDRLIAAAVIAGGLIWVWPGYFPEAAGWGRIDWADYLGPFVFAVVVGLPLLVRRTLPLVTFAVAIAALGASGLVSREVPTPAVVIFLGAYSVGRYAPRRGFSLAALLAAGAIGLASTLGNEGLNAWFLYMLTFLFGLWLTGDTARTRELRAEQLEERAARHEAEQRAAAARAADDERSRIARELHDVIAHNVSVIVVQAAAAGRVIDDDPGLAKASLATIEATGREALVEMRRLLGVLRAGEASPAGPQPSLARLPDLVAEMRAAGLPVELAVEGTPRDLSPGVDLSAYRVVQEALTNALRHAGQTATRVVVRYGLDALDLEIVDQGRDTTAAAAPALATGPDAGHGPSTKG